MTNFDFLKKHSEFESFADIAVQAEELYPKYLDASIMSCHRALEASVKWMFSVDKNLVTWREPESVTLSNLMHTYQFRELIGRDLFEKINFIRKKGNDVKHKLNIVITKGQCEVCLKNLFEFLDYVCCLYIKNYEQQKYVAGYLDAGSQASPLQYADSQSLPLQKQADDVRPDGKMITSPTYEDISYAELLEKNKDKEDEYTAEREKNKDKYNPPHEITEYETRKIYIDDMITDGGFKIGRDCLEEVEIAEMPNNAGKGYADYVLYDDLNVPLAVVEAKRYSVDPAVGRQQAKLYADYLEKKFGRRPVVFLTNGFDTRIIDNDYNEREISAIYSKKDLEKSFKLNRSEIKDYKINDLITDRYYQKEAIKRVCEDFSRKRRKVLLVMATGSGKTRTTASLIDVLQQVNWVENILFLTDRTALINQAKRSFTQCLPNLTLTNLVANDFDPHARCIFSTYQTMINKIDELKDEHGRIFSPGHFDLIVIDEAHRSIYKKYKDIFTYFDALIVGLTATPKDEVGRNTYSEFELENGIPTYAYDLEQAVKDKFLVDYKTVEVKTKFVSEGISYDDLTEDEKEEYEVTFIDDDEMIPDKISSTDLNNWVFNKDTIKKVINELMTKGLRIDCNNKIGKTIIFAENHNHAEEIFNIFNKEYPELKSFVQVIDNKIKYSQSLIDDFSDKDKMPQIAISVDMLDTGIDVPEILNLVFFKKVYSKSKFRQMIGRGTRTCKGLIDGEDKQYFLIFDFCSNFEFFRLNKKSIEAGLQGTLQSNLLSVKIEIVYKLQEPDFKEEIYVDLRKMLIKEIVESIQKIDLNSFRAKAHLKAINEFIEEYRYNYISYQDVITIKEEIAPLLESIDEQYFTVQFDYIMFVIELAYLNSKNATRQMNTVLKLAKNLSNIPNVADIQKNSELLNNIINTEYFKKGNVEVFEHIRQELRGLMKYITKEQRAIKHIDFRDEILEINENEGSQLVNDSLDDYKKKFESYIKEHENDEVIKKIRNNEEINEEDVKKLEEIVNKTLGSKENYEKGYEGKSLIALIRSINGLDMNVAKTLFSEFLDEKKYNANQIYFINQIIEYIVENGFMEDLAVLKSAPFNSYGSIVELYGNQMDVFYAIKNVIIDINEKAEIKAA